MKQVLLVVGMIVSFAATAQQNQIYVKDEYAIGGYDVVAYFKENKPVKGDEKYSVKYKEVNWLFSSKANADLFKEMPEKYAPQYGGYCAYGCSRGYKAKTSYDAWTIVNGKLYFNYNTDVRDSWNKSQEEYIKKADANWPAIKNSKYP